MENLLIPVDMYKILGRTTSLNNTLKQLFGEIDSLKQYQYLTDDITHIREMFMSQQKQMLENLKQSEIGILPIHLIRDKASSSGGIFLRWRSFHSKTGESVWLPILRNPEIPLELKQKFVSAEKERILVNMQISMLNFMLRQISESVAKIKSIEGVLKATSL
ncbi:DUF3158 family protein [Aggregatibacter actinomycetemcomitans]|uniref:DUF3158 family protein n=1 Tax=Aggregatibacter actinomycetemcomitans TaxID=714 RepID=UPI00197C0392|nr:DUF3158 family protein [Aggregatibacter actinomycetemcomitans]MBN6058641.1 DUF3158 family protein [Aggregatibacter actinomycetemcomitans]MBN6087150.1 DUF3158 family protein [Aggregatibacter actinomycetemcomitans]